MRSFNRNKSFLQVISICCVMLFAGYGFAGAIGGARIIPNGKVAVYDGTAKVADLTEESPLPEGKLLKTDGKCGVKMDSLYLVGADQSAMMIQAPDSGRQVMVREGRVYFGITALPQPMAFVTPNGAVMVQQVLLKASANNSLLKGYISVTEETAEIGVIDGGSMIISTADGEKKIDSGHRFILAQAKVPTEEKKDDKASPPPFFLGSGGVVAGTLVTLAAIPIIGNAVSDDDDASPKQ